MKNNRVDIYWKRHFRRAGGLFLGFKYQFPVSVQFITEPDTYRTCVYLSVGFVFWTLHFEFRSKPKLHTNT